MSAAEPGSAGAPVSAGASDVVDGDATIADGPPHGGRPTGSGPAPGRGLALIALALGIAASVSWALALSFWNSPIAPWVTVGLALASVACGAVALERRGHRASAITAIGLAGAVGVFAVAGALPQPDLEAHVYGYAAPSDADTDVDVDTAACPPLPDAPPDLDEEFFYGSLYAADLADKTTADDPVLPWSATVTLAATATQQEIMLMAVGEPIDVTQAALDAEVAAPERGRYIAVPVMYTEPTEGAACISPAWPASWWVTDSGEEIDLTTVSIPEYPTLEDGGLPTEVSLTYYDIFDVDPEAAASGDFQIVLLNPDLTQQVFSWGDASE